MSPDEKHSDEGTTSEPQVTVDHPSVQKRIQGVWKVLTLKETFSLKPTKWVDWNKYIDTIPSMRRFMKDVYALDPTLVCLYLFARAWKAIEPGITVYITSQLFSTIEDYLREGKGDGWAIGRAIFFELCSIIVTSLSTCGERWVAPKLQVRTRQFFEDRWFRENLRYDVQTLMYSKKHSGNAMEAWQSFQGVIETISNMLGLITILSSMFFNHHGGPIFTLVCLIYPILTGNGQYGQIQPMIVYSDNTDYLRSQALRRLVDPDFREDIVTSNVAEHILKEYTQARAALGDRDKEFSFFDRPNDPLQEIMQNIANNLPVMYFAVRAVLSPGSFTLSALAILRQQSSVLRFNVYMCFSLFSSISRTFDQIRFLYTVEVPRLKDGTQDYRSQAGRGMSFELRNVSFDYPGSKTKVGALDGISLKIDPGQLVVIVGSNGSGKSTLIKLLTRMYDVTSGEILVDGVPIQNYKMADLHSGTAILTQNHSIYPLSLAENIGMGFADRLHDVDMIHESTKKGGADELIAKLKDGLQTNIDPIKTAWGYEIDNSKHSLLQDILDTLELPAQVSGGERQRIVASRAFMRLQSPNVNFVAVDEPSSALDPRGELQLFDKLRAEAAGKTMIFVTHRFGHLTKFADLIICMKDGKIAELGKHQELLNLDGEYATLYKIQAQAFANDAGEHEKKRPSTPPDSDLSVEGDS